MAETLTLDQISQVLELVLSQSKFSLANGPELKLHNGLVSLGMLADLSKIKLLPGKLDKFIKALSLRYLVSQQDPGTPVGGLAASAISANATQSNLDASKGGSLRAGGFDRVRELMDASPNTKSPVTQVIFKDRYTTSELLRRSGQLIETTFGQLAKSYDIIDRPEMEPWMEIFMRIYYPNMEELPPTDHVLRLDLDLELMYARGVVPDDLIKVLLKDRPDELIGIYSPLEQGIFYIYPDQDRIADQAQSAMDMVRSRTDVDSSIRLSNSRKVLYALNTNIIPMLGKLLVTGIPGILYTEVAEKTLYPTNDNLRRLCWSKAIVPKTLEKFNKRQWRINPQLDQLHQIGLTLDDLLYFYQFISTAMGIEFNPDLIPTRVVASSESVPDQLPHFIESIITIQDQTPEPGYSTLLLDIDELMARNYHPGSALNQLLSMGLKMVHYDGTHLKVDQDPGQISKFVEEVKDRDLNDPILKEAIFSYVETYGINSVKIREDPSVVPELCITNSLWETYRDAGIEAARAFLIREIYDVMGMSGTFPQPAYVTLMADYMTRIGEPTGLNYFGISRHDTDALHMASFERPMESYRGAAFGTQSSAKSTVGNAITGARAGIGTGALELIPDTSVNALLAALNETKTARTPTPVAAQSQVETAPIPVVTIKPRAGVRRLRTREVDIAETPNPSEPLVVQATLPPVTPAAAEEIIQGTPTLAAKPRRRAVLRKRS